MFKTTSMILIEDVQKVALDRHYPLTPEKYAYVIANYNVMAEEDPTGNLPLWIEQLLDRCEDEDYKEFVERQIDQVFEALKTEYHTSEVSGGEFLDGHRVPQEWDGFLISSYVLSNAIELFRKWDGTDWFFAMKMDGDDWELFNLDDIEFDGKKYPTRTLEVKAKEGDVEGTYMIAPDSLLEALGDHRDDEDSELYDEACEVDEQIYHYVPDWLFYRDAKYIAASDLDMPFELIEE